MNFLEILGSLISLIIVIVVSYKIYRYFFGYSWNSCPNDHDTMARYGYEKCDKCKSRLL